MGLGVAFTQQAIELLREHICPRSGARILLNFLRATRVDKEKIAALPFGSKRARSQFSSSAVRRPLPRRSRRVLPQAFVRKARVLRALGVDYGMGPLLVWNVELVLKTRNLRKKGANPQ